MVNQALIGALRRTKTHISSKLVTEVSLAILASVNSYRLGLLKIRLGPIRLVSSQPKKPQGPVTLLEATHLVCSSLLSRSRVGLRGSGARAMFLENVLCLKLIETSTRVDPH